MTSDGSKPSVLLAWELGAGYGHIGELAPLAAHLRKAGVSVVAALQQPQRWQQLGGDPQVTLLSAPDFREMYKPGTALPSWAAILQTAGFREAQTLRAAVQAWGDIFREQGISHVVGNYAPTALLAAYVFQQPHFTVGTGFHAPPPTEPLAPIPSVSKAGVGELEAVEREVLANCNTVLAELAPEVPRLSSIAALLKYSTPMLCTYAELDHYGGQRLRGGAADCKYFGSQFKSPRHRPVSWPRVKNSHPRLLVYLHRDVLMKNNFLRVAGDMGWPTVAHISALPESLPAGWLPGNVRLYREPINLPSALSSCRVMICASGHGTVSQALLAGKPLLLTPNQAEQTMLGERVVELGAGIMARPGQRNDLPAMLNELVANPKYAKAAQAFAKRYRDRPPSLAEELLKQL